MLPCVILALLVAVVSAIEDGEKAFFAMGNPSFQPMAKQWMPSLNSMGFEDDELRFRNNMGLAGIGGFAGGNDDFFFGGFDDFGENIRFGGLSGLAGTARLGFDDDDGLRTMASFRSTFRAPVLPQGQPVARRISAPFRGYYGDDNDDMFEDFYMMNGFMGAPIGMGMMGAGFRPPYGGTFNFQMRGMFPQMGMGAMGPGMVGIPQALPSPFMMNPLMMRRPMAGPMMMGPMMGGQGPFNQASMAFAQHMAMKQMMMRRHWQMKMMHMMGGNAMMNPMMKPMMGPMMKPMMKPMMGPMMSPMMPMMGKGPMMKMKKF